MIGAEDNEALFCFTDLYQFCTDCTNSKAVGEWYFPNGSMVRTSAHGDSLYMNRSYGVVRLHHRSNATLPTGLYCCEIENSNRTNQSICVYMHDESLPTTSSTPAVREETGTVVTLTDGIDGNEAAENGAMGNGAIVGGAVAGGLLLIAVGIILTLLLINR